MYFCQIEEVEVAWNFWNSDVKIFLYYGFSIILKLYNTKRIWEPLVYGDIGDFLSIFDFWAISGQFLAILDFCYQPTVYVKAFYREIGKVLVVFCETNWAICVKYLNSTEWSDFFCWSNMHDGKCQAFDKILCMCPFTKHNSSSFSQKYRVTQG